MKISKPFNNFLSRLKDPKLVLLALSAGALLTFVLQSFSFSIFEAYLYDLRMRLQATNSQHEHTIIISIDDTTLQQLDEFPPLSLSTHLKLLNTISKAQPKALAYFVNFNDSIDFGSETGTSAAHDFVDLSKKLEAQGRSIFLSSTVRATGEVAPPYPLSKLPYRISLIHKDGTTFAQDKVTRRALFSISGNPLIDVELAALHTGTKQAKDYRGIEFMPEVDLKYFYINYDDTAVGHHSFQEISAIDLINGAVSPSVLDGKIVLIGTKTREDSGDFVYTPFSKQPLTNPTLVLHANIIENLIHNNAIIKASSLVDIIITFIFTSLIIIIVFNTSPVNGVLATIVCSAIIFAASLIIFQTAKVWIHLSHPLIGIFFAYYVFVPYRLIREYKKRWEFQKKNEVLLQVEELKANFMSLITHDLKTPVARIQGMAEILQRSETDPKVVSTIFQSTDELNRFISSILELAKIESDHVKIKKESKDINKIIEKSVLKFEFEANRKKIKLTQELEPLFPMKIDTHLITKVINNLIDNAIKYSPEKSEITISSQESTTYKNFIEIKITDTGHGISEKDLRNLFEKFYRPKNDHTLKNKGSGLGLYLSRYFVQLHNGSLQVSSIESQGSTFTILLPIDDSIELYQFNQTKRGEPLYV